MHRFHSNCVENPAPEVRHALRLHQVSFTPLQGFLGAYAFRDIDHRADYLNKLSVGAQDWMDNAMNVSNRSVGFHDSKFNIAIYFLQEGSIARQLELVAVFRMYSLDPGLQPWQTLLRIEAEQSEHGPGPGQGGEASAVNSATARLGQLLRFREISFAALEILLCLFALLDIDVCSVPFDDFPIFIEAWSGAEQKPTVFAVETT